MIELSKAVKEGTINYVISHTRDLGQSTMQLAACHTLEICFFMSGVQQRPNQCTELARTSVPPKAAERCEKELRELALRAASLISSSLARPAFSDVEPLSGGGDRSIALHRAKREDDIEVPSQPLVDLCNRPSKG